MAPIFWHMNTVLFEYSPLPAIAICLLLAVAYVGSLYIGTDKDKGRDHPETIKARFIRVGIVCTVTVPFLWLCASNSHSSKARVLFTWIGLRFEGLIQATILPLILTMILFAGPLSLHYLDGIFQIYKDPKYWWTNLKNLIWLRNHVVAPFAEEFLFRGVMLPFLVPPFGEEAAIKLVPFFFSAPLTEEFIFRACMLPLLVPSLGERWAIFICPLSFGVAHFHHLIEKIREGNAPKAAILQSVFQFSYTTVFGAYSAFLFLRTGHLIAPVVAHAFCNHMGFPNFTEVLAQKPPVRYYIVAAFIGGFIAWWYLLYALTVPWLYGNDLYYS